MQTRVRRCVPRRDAVAVQVHVLAEVRIKTRIKMTQMQNMKAMTSKDDEMTMINDEMKTPRDKPIRGCIFHIPYSMNCDRAVN